MASLSLMLAIGLCRTKVARFYRLLAYILIISDIAYAIFMIGTEIEVMISPPEQHQEKYGWYLATNMGVTVFLYYYGGSLAHWLYSYRYWVISQEIPHILYGRSWCMSAEETRRKEKCYKIAEWIGTLINLFVCLVTAILRFTLSIYLTSTGAVPDKIVRWSVIFNVSVTVLQLISGLLLLVALAQINRELSKVPGAKKKTGSFIAHFGILITHIVSLATCQFYILRCFANPTPEHLHQQVVGRFGLGATTFLTQAVMIYFFVTVISPVFSQSSVVASTVEDFDALEDSNRSEVISNYDD
jgi:hypothetical protein